MPEYNIKDTVKLNEKLDSIYKRDTLRTIPNVQDGAFAKMFNMVS